MYGLRRADMKRYGHNRRWQIEREAVPFHDAFIEECVALWNQGLDSYDIAKILFEHEACVEVALWTARERRREKTDEDSQDGAA
jgi:hypothetical protein